MYTARVRPVVPLKLLPLSEQTVLLDVELRHANAAVNASGAYPAFVTHTTEAGVKRYTDTQWERE